MPTLKLVVPRITAKLLTNWPLLLATFIFSAVLTAFFPLLTPKKVPKNAPRLVGGYPVFGSTAFMTDRSSFVSKARSDPHASRSFSFFLGKYHIVSPGGLDGRSTVLEAKDNVLELSSGYGLLLSGKPPVEHNDTGNDRPLQTMGTMIARIKTPMLLNSLPKLVRETQSRMKRMIKRYEDPQRPGTGVFAPLNELFVTAYALLNIHFGANEIARDPKLFERSFVSVKAMIAQNMKVKNVLFPWLGRIASFGTTINAIKFFRLMSGIVEARKKNDVKEDDWVQTLTEAGYDTKGILVFVISAMFAGTANTADAACDVPAYVITNDAWYKRVQEEIDAVIARHRQTPSQTAADVLQTLPMSAWEEQFPVLQLCLHETLRNTTHSPIFRQNVSGSDLPIGKTGEVIPNGSYVALTMDEVHRDERFYKDAHKWDPSRFEGDSPEGTQDWAFIAWGGGRHKCIGMRFAKLLECIIIVHLLAIFKLEALDEQGSVIKRQPSEKEMKNMRFRFQVREGSI